MKKNLKRVKSFTHKNIRLSAITLGIMTVINPVMAATAQNNLVVDSDGAVAVGSDANASGAASVAIGKGAKTDTSGAIAIGDKATAVVSGTTLANGSVATGGIAIGTGTRSNHQDTIAMGTGASATNVNAAAIGTGASAIEDATAIGAGSLAEAPRSIALSKEAKTTGGESIALGYQAEAKSFGTALGSKSKTEDNFALAVGYEAQAIGQQSTAVGYKANTTKKAVSGIAVGQEASAQKEHAMAMGYQAVASELRATAIGDTARASAVDAIAQGTEAKAIARSAIATGKSAIASEENAMAQGTGAKAFKADSIAQGTNAQAVGDSAVAIGKDSYVGSATHTLEQIQAITDAYNNALNEQTTLNASRDANVARLDELSAERTRLSRQRPAAPREQIAAIDAQIMALETELDEINEKLDTADKAVKTTRVAFDVVQGAGVRGIAIGDTAKVHAKDGLALGAGAIVADGLENAVALGANSVVTAVTAAPDADIKGITYGDFAGNNPSAGDVVSVGSVGKERRIQNVAAGRITADSTDAINGSQLYIVAEKLNKQNYIHVNPSENPTTTTGANNEAAVDGIGNATGGKALAAGFNATASGKSSIAIGDKASADNLGGIAIGQGAISSTVDKNASADVAQTLDGVNKAIAIGNSAQATNSKTVAIGDAAAASGQNAVAIGSQTKSTGTESAVIGSAAEAHGNFSVAIGQRANVTSTGFAATAIGNLALASGSEATALGRSAKAEGSQATAIGLNATAVGESGIAMGTRANASAVHSVAISTEAEASEDQSIAIGRSAKSYGASSVAMGNNAKVLNGITNSVAIGNNAQVIAGGSAVALGVGATATNYHAVAIGNTASAAGSAIAIGQNASASLANSTAMGAGATTSLINSVAIGYGATTTAATPTTGAIINGISYGLVNGVGASFAGANRDTNYVFSVGKAGDERQIQNVAAGRISNTSTDAINGSQLYIVASELKTYVDDSNTIVKTGKNTTVTKTPVQTDDSHLNEYTVDAWDTTIFAKSNGGVTITPTISNDQMTRTYEVSVNTDGTTIKVDPNSGNITANTGDLTNTDGKINTPVNDEADKLTTVGDVAQAINESGFKLTTTKSTGEVEGTTEELINPSDLVTIDAGNNIKLIQDKGKITVATQKDVKFDSVTVGTTNPITINNVGINMNDKLITNINNGLINGANNLRNLDNNTVDNKTAATVGDLRNMGWVVSSNKTTGTAEGQTTDTAFSQNVKNANEVQFVGTGIAKVSGDVKDGKNVITIHVDKIDVPNPQTSSIATDAKSGQIGIKNGDNTVNTTPIENQNNLVTANDVVNAVNNAFWKVFETDATVANKKDDVKAGDNLVFAKGDGTTVSVTNTDGKTTTVKYNVNVDNATIKIGDDGKITANTTTLTDGDNDGKIDDVANDNKGNLVTAQNVADAINASGFKLKTSATINGVKEIGTANDGELINPSDTVEMVADKNLTVKQDANGKIIYATSEEVDFNKVTISSQAPVYTNQVGDELVKQGDKYFTKDGNIEVPVNEVITTNPNAVNLTTKEGKAVNNVGTSQTTANKPNELNIAGNDNSLTQITGVSSTLNTQEVAISPTGTSSQGVSNLVNLTENGVNSTSAATVGDLQNMGWIVSASSNDYKDTVKNANQVNFVGTGLAKVVGETVNGIRTITVDVNAQSVIENTQIPVVYTNTQGDKVYKQVDAQGNVTFNTKPDGKGDVVQPVDVIASMNNGSNNTTAPMALSNVASNLVNVTTVNEKQPDANSLANLESKKNNAATVADVLNAGWNLQNNGSAIDIVTHNDAVNFIDGRATTVSVEANEDGTVNNIKVDIETDDKTITVKDGKLTTVTTMLEDVNVDGKIDAPVNGDSLVNATTVANAINNSGFIATASGNTNGATKDQLIKTGEKITLDAGKNLTVTQTDGKFSFATKEDVNFNSVQFGDIATGPKITHDGNNIKVGDVNGNTTKITNVANGDISPVSNEVINGGQLNNYAKVNGNNVNVVNGSINIVNGNGTTVTTNNAGEIKVNVNNTDLNVSNGSQTNADGSVAIEGTLIVQNPNGTGANYVNATTLANAVNNVSWKVNSKTDTVTANAATKNTYVATGNTVKAGEKVNINAGRNIEISGSGKDINIAVSDNPEFNSVIAKTSITVGQGDTATMIKSDANGMSVAKIDGSPQRINNVSNGIADNDAVNVSQLKGVANQFNNKINQNKREARAGIAGSNAAAGLPQVYIPGKSMVAAAVGTYKGENAIAVGYSRASDNGKLIIKLQGNANTRKDYGASVGVGYQW